MTTFAQSTLCATPRHGPTPGRTFAVGSAERDRLDAALAEIGRGCFDVPNVIGGRAVRGAQTKPIVLPHRHEVQLGQVHTAGAAEVDAAIAAAATARRDWARLTFDARAEPFARAADMLEFGPWRERLVAACMLELSKTSDQADGDAAAETVDFIRANLENAVAMANVQPSSPCGVSNHVEYRPLEGFVFAITPFNFVSMNNLAAEVNGLVQRYRKQGLQVSKDTAYLGHILTYVRHGAFAGLTNQRLRELGADVPLAPGMPEFMQRTRALVAADQRYSHHGIKVEHYIVSTGLRQMIEGNPIRVHVDDVWACELLCDPPGPGYLSWSCLTPS